MKLVKGILIFLASVVFIIPQLLHSEAIFKLPFTPQDSFMLTRGYNTPPTHINKDAYAIDFAKNGCDAYGKPTISTSNGYVYEIKPERRSGGYGNMVKIDHGNGLYSIYAHLQTILTDENKSINQGIAVGLIGNTGNVSGTSCPEHPGTHLHFAVYEKQPDGTLVAYKPEPISGYTNLLAGNWYTSDNSAPSTALASGGSSGGTETTEASQTNESNLSWWESLEATFETVLNWPSEVFASIESVFASDATEEPTNPAPPSTPEELVYDSQIQTSIKNNLETIPTEIIQLELVSINTGTRPWGSEVSLNTYGNDATKFYHSSWITPKRPAKLEDSQVSPGALGHFKFSIQAPSEIGDYSISFRPVYQDATGFHWIGEGDSIFTLKISVKPQTPTQSTSPTLTLSFSHSPTSQSAAPQLSLGPSGSVAPEDSVGRQEHESSGSSSRGGISTDETAVAQEASNQTNSASTSSNDNGQSSDESATNNEEGATETLLPDTEPPTLTLAELPAITESLEINLSWEASDSETENSSASGVSFFDVFYEITFPLPATSTASSTPERTSLGQTSSTEYKFEGENKKKYKFKVRATDNAGNSSEAESNEVEISLPHVVISEIQVGGGGNARDEFIELYNPSGEEVSLAGWKLSRKTASGATHENLVNPFSDGTIIGPHKFFLITHPKDWTGDITSDLTYSTDNSIAPNNTIILYDANGEIVDLVGYGETSLFEGSAPAESLESNGKTLARQDLKDTDDNQTDFEIANIPNPQNSESKPNPTDDENPVPAKITDLEAPGSKIIETGATLNWATPQEAKLEYSAYFDLRYEKLSGPSDCKLNINWTNATEADGEPAPGTIPIELVSLSLVSLEPNTYYCAGVKTFNGAWHSHLSNLVTFKTLRSGANVKAKTTVPPEVRANQTITLTADNNPYYIEEEWFIPKKGKGVIGPGVVIKFGPRYRSGFTKFPTKIRVQGSLDVQGTSANPVILTSINDDAYGGDTNGDGSASSPQARDWGSLQFENGSAESVKISGARIRYGGDNQGDGNGAGGVIFWREHAPLTIENSRIENNYTGLNALLWPDGDAINTARISNSTISGNSYYGVYSDGKASIDAQSNFWGNATGPTHTGNPTGTGDKVTDGINFSNWLTVEP